MLVFRRLNSLAIFNFLFIRNSAGVTPVIVQGDACCVNKYLLSLNLIFSLSLVNVFLTFRTVHSTCQFAARWYGALFIKQISFLAANFIKSLDVNAVVLSLMITSGNPYMPEMFLREVITEADDVRYYSYIRTFRIYVHPQPGVWIPFPYMQWKFGRYILCYLTLYMYTGWLSFQCLCLKMEQK